MKKTLQSLVAVLSGVMLFACASGEAEVTAEDNLDFTAGETFKLYESRTTLPDSFCDKHKLLTMGKATSGGRTVTFESKIGGTCSLAARPDKTQFVVKKTTTDNCGAVRYEGTGQAASQDTATAPTASIVILDQRKRRCPGERARLEVSINDALPLYAPQAVPARPVCTVGPHTYAEGEKFKDRCNTCTCNAVNAVSCTDLVCL